MEFRNQAMEKKTSGNPLPRRGQVKARIFGALVRSVVPSLKERGRRYSRGWPQPAGEETGYLPASPATSGYTSSLEHEDDASEL